MKTLKDLQAMPDEQRYLCTDASIAARHNLVVPFECGCRLWLGYGVVRVWFYSKNLDYPISLGNPFQDSDCADIRTLQLKGAEKWMFDVIPEF
jgi:hypothetical protein